MLQQLIGFINEGKCTGKIGVPSSTVLVGHSFGSILSHGIAKVAPHTVDAIILTGYLPVATYLNVEIIAASWQPRIANLEGQGRWHDYDTGYVTWVDLFSNVDTYVFISVHRTLPPALSLALRPNYQPTVIISDSSKAQAMHKMRLYMPRRTSSLSASPKPSQAHLHSSQTRPSPNPFLL